jgi:hypothetical protein
MPKRQLFKFDAIPHKDNRMTDVNKDGTLFVLGRWLTFEDGREEFVAGPPLEAWMGASWFPHPAK